MFMYMHTYTHKICVACIYTSLCIILCSGVSIYQELKLVMRCILHHFLAIYVFVCYSFIKKKDKYP